MRLTFPPLLFLLIATILALEILASVFYWYWIYWWFDILMHFLGGLWVGAATLWFLFSSGYFRPQEWTIRAILFATAGCVLGVALAWEAFEYAVRLLVPQPFPYDLEDTTADVIVGLLGGLTATFAFIAGGYTKRTTEPKKQA